jgi:hypothetical protein
LSEKKKGKAWRERSEGKAESLKGITKEGKLVFLFFREKLRRKESPIKQSKQKLSFCAIGKDKGLLSDGLKAEGKRSGKHGRKAEGKKRKGSLPASLRKDQA